MAVIHGDGEALGELEGGEAFEDGADAFGAGAISGDIEAGGVVGEVHDGGADA